MCIYGYSTCLSVCFEVRKQLVEIDSLVSPSGFPRLNSGHQTWHKYLYPLRYLACPNQTIVYWLIYHACCVHFFFSIFVRIINIQQINYMWWHMPVTSVIGKWRQEDQESNVILGYITNWRPAWVQKNKINPTNNPKPKEIYVLII